LGCVRAGDRACLPTLHFTRTTSPLQQHIMVKVSPTRLQQQRKELTVSPSLPPPLPPLRFNRFSQFFTTEESMLCKFCTLCCCSTTARAPSERAGEQQLTELALNSQQPKLLGTTENSLGLKPYCDEQGWEYVVTSSKVRLPRDSSLNYKTERAKHFSFCRRARIPSSRSTSKTPMSSSPLPSTLDTSPPISSTRRPTSRQALLL
jgi:hypothetical protein